MAFSLSVVTDCYNCPGESVDAQQSTVKLIPERPFPMMGYRFGDSFGEKHGINVLSENI